MFYDMKCDICGYEEEINKSITDTMPVPCRNPEYRCFGIMENITMFKSPIGLSKEAIPTRNMDKAVKYSVR